MNVLTWRWNRYAHDWWGGGEVATRATSSPPRVTETELMHVPTQPSWYGRQPAPPLRSTGKRTSTTYTVPRG